ncbi:MAG TPA: transglycosylase SLT domain-containing protein [Burkholderiaceae bacterium]|nr:transglycosylase SLT domain-containing protein [Burkholderiaceae bacterium]
MFKTIWAFIRVLLAPTKNETVLEIPAKPRRTLAWGNKVSAEFREVVFTICAALGIEPDYLMACIAWESAETFRPDIKNMAGSGATGLIQFMPKTAVGLGTTVEALARMTAVEQLDYVRMYFKPYQGRLKTLSDVYMAILWPAAIGMPENYILWKKGTHPTTYRQNAGLDLDRDHDIEKQEAAAKVQAKLKRGRRPEYLWVES